MLQALSIPYCLSAWKSVCWYVCMYVRVFEARKRAERQCQRQAYAIQ